ncbi:MAG: MFS transporter [Acidobacteriota bacterium]
MTAPQPPRIGWTTLAPILTVHFCGTLGFSIALPILVFLVADLGGAPWAYGLLGATFSAAQMIGAPVLGRWSDRVGRKTILAVSQGGTVVAWLLFLLALYLPKTTLGAFAGTTLTVPLLVIFLARLLDGLTGGNISVANAYVADLTRDAKAERQRAFGRMGMAASVGFTAGPALAGLLASESDPYTRPVMASITIATIGVVLCLRLKEPKGRCPDGPPPQGNISRALSQQQVPCDQAPAPRARSAIVRMPQARVALAMTFVMFLGFNIFYAAFPVHATTRIGWGPGDLGTFFAAMSAAMFLVQGPLLGAASSRLRPTIVFGVGLACLSLAFLMYAGGVTASAYLGGALFALGNGLAWPTFQARASSLVSESDQGAFQGALASAGSLASITGLILGGVLYPILGGRVFWASGALFVLVFLASARLYRSPDAS